MSLFKGKIICECGRKHKTKNPRGKGNIVYICSTYDNYGSSKCHRNKVAESELLELLSFRFKNLANEEIAKEVSIIYVYLSKIEIHLKNDSTPIVSSETYLQL